MSDEETDGTEDLGVWLRGVHDDMRVWVCEGCKHHWDERRKPESHHMYMCDVVMARYYDQGEYEEYMVPPRCPRRAEYRTVRRLREL